MTPSDPVPSIGRAAAEPDVIAPDGSEIRLLADARHGAARASLCEARLAPGAVSRPMVHRTVEEIWHVTGGHGDVWRCPPDRSSAEPVHVRAGDTIVIPAGWRFQFRAAPDCPFTFLCYTTPAWPGADEAQPAGSGGLGTPTV